MPAAASSVAVLTHTVVTTSTVAGCDLNANDPQLSVILNSSVTVDPPPLPPASAIAPEESELSIHVHIDAGTTCTGPLIVTASVYSPTVSCTVPLSELTPPMVTFTGADSPHSNGSPESGTAPALARNDCVAHGGVDGYGCRQSLGHGPMHCLQEASQAPHERSTPFMQSFTV